MPLNQKHRETPHRNNRPIKGAWLGARTHTRWSKVSDLLQNTFDIPSQAPASSYRKFISTFPKIRKGDYHATFSHTVSESLVMLTLSKWIARKSIRAFGRDLSLLHLPAPANVVKLRFVLTSNIEPELSLPIDRRLPASVCAVTSIQGPGRKYFNPEALAKELTHELGQPWQNYLLSTVISHSRELGFQAVALLRPEYNPKLTDSYLKGFGVSPEEAHQMRSQFYPAAKANGLRKFKGSKYLWIFFDRNM